MRDNAVLVARGAKVEGNIQATNQRRVVVAPRRVNDRVVRSPVGGDVQLESGGRGHVVRTLVGGNLQVRQNSLRQVANRNVVDGDLQAFSNKGGFRILGNRDPGPWAVADEGGSVPPGPLPPRVPRPSGS